MSEQNASWCHPFRPHRFLQTVGAVLDDTYTHTYEALEHLALALLAYALLCVLLYYSIVRWNAPDFRQEIRRARRVLLITAHPDDECMFFGPTIVDLVKQKGCTLYLMCLSTGKNYGMGKVRKKELYAACKALGIEEGCITIRDHSLLPDSMEAKWPVEVIANMILTHVEVYNIDAVVTFDRDGVSGHKNHCHIYYAVAEMALEKRLPSSCDVYVLESVNILRKYSLLLDIPLCFILSSHRYILNWKERRVVRNAMGKHRSQLRWYRKLYFIFSRFTLINTLQRLNVADLELELQLDE